MGIPEYGRRLHLQLGALIGYFDDLCKWFQGLGVRSNVGYQIRRFLHDGINEPGIQQYFISHRGCIASDRVLTI